MVSWTGTDISHPTSPQVNYSIFTCFDSVNLQMQARGNTFSNVRYSLFMIRSVISSSMLMIKIFSFLLIFFHILHATTSFVIAEVSQQVSKKVGAESNISLQKEHQATKKVAKCFSMVTMLNIFLTLTSNFIRNTIQ